MKFKSDFVTNSSSASFVIAKKHLTKKQIMLIHDHFGVGMILAEQLNKDTYTGPYPLSSADEWKIDEYFDRIVFDTWMDNFDMWWFLKEIGVKNEYIPLREN
jgi:hypothetical protein